MLILIVVFCLTIYCIITHNKSEKNCCIIDNNKYPQAQFIFDNKNIIIKELEQLKKLDKWSQWDATDNKYKQTPIFTKMSKEEIYARIRKNEGYLNSSDKGWRLFGLILYGAELYENTKYCPKTISLLKQIPGVINAGISVLEPGCKTTKHRDYDRSFYRLHVPLEIPDGDCYIEINNEIVKWNMDHFFIFNDNCLHLAANNTKYNRFVLIVDLKR